MTLVVDSDSGPMQTCGGRLWNWLLVATRAKSPLLRS